MVLTSFKFSMIKRKTWKNVCLNFNSEILSWAPCSQFRKEKVLTVNTCLAKLVFQCLWYQMFFLLKGNRLQPQWVTQAKKPPISKTTLSSPFGLSLLMKVRLVKFFLFLKWLMCRFIVVNSLKTDGNGFPAIVSVYFSRFNFGTLKL